MPCWSVVVLLLLVVAVVALALDQDKLDELVLRMEGDALDLAKQVERLYAGRCDLDVLTRCTRGNYHECLSRLPTQQCLVGEDLALRACGDGIECSALWDTSVSTVRIPKALITVTDEEPAYVDDPAVIEPVCFSQGLDDYFATKRATEEEFWTNLNVRPPQVYFGSASGAFRIFPGRSEPDERCYSYDPRTRPWCVGLTDTSQTDRFMC